MKEFCCCICLSKVQYMDLVFHPSICLSVHLYTIVMSTLVLTLVIVCLLQTQTLLPAAIESGLYFLLVSAVAKDYLYLYLAFERQEHRNS